jgi:hypothetical protein
MSPQLTNPRCEFPQLSPCNVDAYFINTDEVHYGGSLDDLKNATRTSEGQAVPLIYKDFIIHPIQVSSLIPFCFLFGPVVIRRIVLLSAVLC